MRQLLFIAVLLGTLPVSAQRGTPAADDWPQYFGAGRDGVYRGTPIADARAAGGPKVFWKKPVGVRVSRPVV